MAINPGEPRIEKFKESCGKEGTMCSQGCAGMYRKLLIVKCFVIIALSCAFLVTGEGSAYLFTADSGQQKTAENEMVPDIEHPMQRIPQRSIPVLSVEYTRPDIQSTTARSWPRPAPSFPLDSVHGQLYNAQPDKYLKDPPVASMAWVVLYPDAMYQSAFGSHYVVGSEVDGSMGKETIPYKFKKDAEQFMQENGGKTGGFPWLDQELVIGGN